MHPIKEICRILTLMKRLLILIFAFNALFIAPVSATDVCEMMDGSNLAMMTSSMSGQMADMDCGMDAEIACSSLECASSCSTTTASQIISDQQISIVVASYDQPRAGFAYFYIITLPVHTPPPLV